MTDPSQPVPFPPDGPEPVSRDAIPPFIIDQRPGPGATVRVTWSLPGLRRLIVTVPYARWVEGQHLAIAPGATEILDGLLPQIVDDSDNDQE